MTYADTRPGRAAKAAAAKHRVGSKAFWRAYRKALGRKEPKKRRSQYMKQLDRAIAARRKAERRPNVMRLKAKARKRKRKKRTRSFSLMDPWKV